MQSTVATITSIQKNSQKKEYFSYTSRNNFKKEHIEKGAKEIIFWA
jgi:hypothetical protein